MSKKVLVIGGNGFIGTNIANHLYDQGYEVEIYDIAPKENGFKNYVGNILTDDNLDSIIKQFDNIIYLVTSVSPKKSMDFPEKSYTQDIPMLLRVLDSCNRTGKGKKVIFSSSGGTVYGEGLGKELREDYVIETPINHYANCKLACEKILLLYNNLYGMNNVVLRISNPYGKEQKPESGVGIITTFVDKLNKGETLTLYGKGDTVRDFIDVEDVAIAFEKAIEYENQENVTPVFNVGSGIGLSLKEILDIISQAMEIEPKVDYLPARSFDVKSNILNMEKSHQYLGLNPSTREKVVDSIADYAKNKKKVQGKQLCLK